MFMKQTKVWLILTIALSLLALASACSKAPESGTNDAGTTTGKTYSGDVGSIAGSIAYNGTPPAPKKIDTSADPVCGQKNPNLETEDNVVKDGKLANVFVYIKDGTLADGTKIRGKCILVATGVALSGAEAGPGPATLWARTVKV